jgi:hypothetical protein
MYAGTALHGMTQADTDLLFKVLGRPITIRQITTGEARGGTYNGDTSQIPEAYLRSLQEGNIRPEWYSLDYANRYSYPSLFQLNALVKANAITADLAADWAAKDGLAPEVVTALHGFWSGEQGASSTAGAVKAKTYTYSQIHQAWRNGVFTDQQAETELETIGYPAAKAQTLLATWKATPPSGA